MGLFGSKSSSPNDMVPRSEPNKRFRGPFHGSRWYFVSATNKDGSGASALSSSLAGSGLDFHDMIDYRDRSPRTIDTEQACTFLVGVRGLSPRPTQWRAAQSIV
jgi:hypothetical protein